MIEASVLCKIAEMRAVSTILISALIFLHLACTKAAAPVAIGNKPISVNGKSKMEIALSGAQSAQKTPRVNGRMLSPGTVRNVQAARC